MALIKAFHVVNFALLTFYGTRVVYGLHGNALIYWWLYAGLLCGLLLNNIWCARLLILPPLVIVGWTAPMVLYNFTAFATRDPLYLDSPATIIVVAIVALFVTVPSTVVLWAYWHERRQIFGSKKA